MISSQDTLRVSVLSEALPYIQRFAGRRVVVKYGGAAMVQAELRDAVYRDLVLLASVGVQPVVVHGGGPEINDWLNRLQIEPEFRNGLRVTTPETMDVVEMVLVGRVNKQIVNGLNRVGGRAVGLCGSDGSLVRARTYANGANGLVGEVAEVDPAVLFPLLDAGYIPVISSVAADWEGQAPQHQRRHGGRRIGRGDPGREANPAHRHGRDFAEPPQPCLLNSSADPGGCTPIDRRWRGGRRHDS